MVRSDHDPEQRGVPDHVAARSPRRDRPAGGAARVRRAAHAVPPLQGPEQGWSDLITIPNNEACLITSRHGRRVEIGPQVVLLEYEEQLMPFRLSKGPSKDGQI